MRAKAGRWYLKIYHRGLFLFLVGWSPDDKTQLIKPTLFLHVRGYVIFGSKLRSLDGRNRKARI